MFLLQCVSQWSSTFKFNMAEKFFPTFFIEIKRFLEKLSITGKKSDSVSDKKEKFICLELLGKISFQSKKQLTGIFRTCNESLKVYVIFKSLNRIRKVFCFKYIIPTFMNLKVVYKFNATSAMMFTSAKQNVTFW